MALVQKKWREMLLFCVFMILKRSFAQQNTKVPCLFFYGDSISDNGNNNNRFTSAKSNYLPYGIDFFPLGPTGRFTNQANLADFLARQLGFPFSTPPFARFILLSNRKVLKGVNYASGGAGILNETGRVQGDVINLSMQIQNHRRTVTRINRILGNNNSSGYLKQCLHVVQIGNNDYLNNYFLPGSTNTSRQYTPQQFATLLVQEYKRQLQILHELGARKIAVFGLTQPGCTPFAIRNFPPFLTPCVDRINSAAQIFNQRLIPAIDEFNRNFTDAKFVYINSIAIEQRFVLRPDTGFRVTNRPCCRTKRDTGLCIPLSIPCRNRSEYIFWDEFHPTGALYQNLAEGAYRATSPLDARPFGISRLVEYEPPSQ